MHAPKTELGGIPLSPRLIGPVDERGLACVSLQRSKSACHLPLSERLVQADGTRSSALSIAVVAFRSFRSHPDKNLAAASEQALAGCGTILYPRAAPLHLPHAVTDQARAWGASSVGSHGASYNNSKYLLGDTLIANVN